METSLVFFALSPFLAVLLDGLARKIRARMQNREGPPVLQSLFDFAKLMRKMEPEGKKSPSIFFRLAPFLSLGFVWSIFLIFPLPLLSFGKDFLLLIYFLLISDLFHILAGIASNSPFGILGSMRRLSSVLACDLGLALATLSFFVYEGAGRISEFSAAHSFAALPLSCLGLLALVSLKEGPFSSAKDDPEIIEGILTEYSGPMLAVLSLAEHMKRLVFVSLASFLLVGLSDPLAFSVLFILIVFLGELLNSSTASLRHGTRTKVCLGIFLLLLVEFVWVTRMVMP